MTSLVLISVALISFLLGAIWFYKKGYTKGYYEGRDSLIEYLVVTKDTFPVSGEIKVTEEKTNEA